MANYSNGKVMLPASVRPQTKQHAQCLKLIPFSVPTAESPQSEQGLAKRALEGEQEGIGFAQDSNRLKRNTSATLLKGETSKEKGEKNISISVVDLRRR